MVILFDKTKIQDNLAWSKHTGDLIGFVDLASHVLVFILIRRVVNPFKFNLANFATKNTTTCQIFPFLETYYNL